MNIYQVIHNDQVIEFKDLNEAQNYATTNNCEAPQSLERDIPVDYKTSISEVILHNRKLSELLLIDLYADNTMAGITVEQSDALFDEYADVILRIEQGGFPTAIYRLQQKEPSGFVTQALLDKWIQTIQSYIGS